MWTRTPNPKSGWLCSLVHLIKVYGSGVLRTYSYLHTFSLDAFVHMKIYQILGVTCTILAVVMTSFDHSIGLPVSGFLLPVISCSLHDNNTPVLGAGIFLVAVRYKNVYRYLTFLTKNSQIFFACAFTVLFISVLEYMYYTKRRKKAFAAVYGIVYVAVIIK